jgi:hypothetical protein
MYAGQCYSQSRGSIWTFNTSHAAALSVGYSYDGISGNINFKPICPGQQLEFKHMPLTMISQVLKRRRISLSRVGNNDTAITTCEGEILLQCKIFTSMNPRMKSFFTS